MPPRATAKKVAPSKAVAKKAAKKALPAAKKPAPAPAQKPAPAPAQKPAPVAAFSGKRAPLTPGRGWRSLVIGAHLKDVVRDLGKPSHTDRIDDFFAVDWRPLGIRAYLDLQERVTSVTAIYREIYKEGFKSFPSTTDRGVGRSSTLAQVETAHGPAPERRGPKGDTLIYEGIVFTFENGKLYDLVIDPEVRPAPRKPLPAPRPYNKLGRKVLQIVADLERRLAPLAKKRGGPRLVFTPIEPAWLDNYEHHIGHRLPPSYRQLVLERGTLRVEVGGYTTCWMIPVEDLGGPSPTAWVDEGNAKIDAAVGRAIYFAYESDDAVENFYAFDPKAVDKSGEMPVSIFFHDERFKGGGDLTFADYLERVIAELFELHLT